MSETDSPFGGWRALADAIPGLLGLQSGEGFVYVSRERARALGVDPDALADGDWRALIDPADEPRLERAIERARRDGGWEGEAALDGDGGAESPVPITLSRVGEDALAWLTAGRESDPSGAADRDESHDQRRGAVEAAEGTGRADRGRDEYEGLLEESRRRYGRLIESAPVPIWVQREEELLYLNDAAVDFFGADDAAEVVGRSDLEFVVAEEREQSRERNRRILEEGEVLSMVEGRKVGLDGEVRQGLFAGAPITFEGGEALLVIARDITDRKERERELEQYERIIETVDDGVYALDEALRFTFVNEALCDLLGRSREELLGTSAPELFDDPEEESMAEEMRRQVVGGDRTTGTVRASLPSLDDERTVEAHYRLHPESGDEFRGSVGVIRDVTEREKRERALRRQRDALATLDRINELLLETAREVIQTASREAVERTVCERLAASDLYRFAWVGQREPDGDRIVPRTSAGEGEDYLEAVTITDDDSETGRGPGGRAMRTGEVQTVNVEDPAFEPWRAAARERGFESVAAVPLRHGETVYGVLTVCATREDAFGERERAGFDTLGRSVGFVIHAARSHELLFADAVVELVFDVTGTDSALVRAAADLGCDLELDGYVSSGDRWILYVSVEGRSAEGVISAVAAGPLVERGRVIEGSDARIELIVAESSFLHTVAAVGATVRAARAGPDEARLVLEAPADADVRELVEHVTSAYPEADLRARREHDRDVTRAGRPGGVLDALTDRQRETLEAAYRAGYFDWPRESTAEEVADSLDLAPATLHGHVRKAEWAILTALFDHE